MADPEKLFQFANSATHVIFAGKFYGQIDGVTVGSPLGLVLGNLFMRHHEKSGHNYLKYVN